MARKQAPVDTSFTLFNVVYEDGTRSSNRKVPAAEVQEGPDAVKAFLEAQDRKIAELSGNPRGPIKSAVKA